MKRSLIVISFALWPQIVLAESQQEINSSQYLLAQSYSCGKTCGKVRSCEEAVYQWCVCGYSRADGDNDGVPCEKVCGQSSAASLRRVNAFKEQFQCR